MQKIKEMNEEKRHKERGDDPCPECHSYKIVEDTQRGERICYNCGVVIESKVISDNPRDNWKQSKQSKPLNPWK